MSAPEWLRQALKEHGARAVAEGWRYTEWMAHGGLETDYRAKEATYLLRSDPTDRLSPPTLEGLAERLATYQSKRQRRKAAKDIQAPEGDDGRAGNTYDISDTTGDYRFWILGRAAPVVLSRDQVAELVASYVHDGGGQTQSSLARQLALPRRVVNAILKALQVVKDSPPFPPEEISERPEEDLLDEWVASKAAKLERRAHRSVWAQVEKDARQWRDLHRSILQHVEAATARAIEDGAAAPDWIPTEGKAGDCALLVVPTDVHVGKYGWAGFGPGATDLDDTKRRLWTAVRRVVDLAPGDPSVIYLTIGGDFFHADTLTATTTKGTPQDMSGTPEQMIVEGFRLAHELVRALALVAPVRLILHAGNHDAALALALYASLVEAHRSSGRIEPAGDADHPWGPYQAVRYGCSLLGFTHGDGRHKVADLGPLMAQRWPKLWAATTRRYWFTGHRHHLAVEEARGVEVHTVPSVSGQDRYHSRHWPHASRARLGGYVFDPDRGMVAQVWGDVEPGAP